LKVTTKLLLGAALRLVLIGFACWFAIDQDSVPNAPPLTRIALASGFLVLSILAGEISSLRIDLGLVAAALRGRIGSPPRDDKAAVDILVRALSASSETTRTSAHAQLKRLTGQDLPLDAEAWSAWWGAHRDSFTGRGEGS
jgi:hypothetical protein